MSIKPMMFGIAGGSGAGKSTLAFYLKDKFPDHVGIVHLDDYNKKKDQAPTIDGITNWDDPAAINFDQLVADLKALSEGTTIKVHTKNERDNPLYYTGEKKRLEIEIEPKPIMIIEGYLLLHDSRIRDYMSYSVFLDLPHEIRANRRTKLKNDILYTEKILIPMHEKYVEPTKQYSNEVIMVADKSIEEIAQGFIEVFEKFRK